MSSTKTIKIQHDPKKKHVVGVMLKNRAKTAAVKLDDAIIKPNGVFQLNGKLKKGKKTLSF